MNDTWFNRDLPVLDAIVQFLDEKGGLEIPDVNDIAERSGIEKAEVARAVLALEGVFIDLRKVMSGGDPGPWHIMAVSPQARLAVGQWPSPESVVDRLSAGLADAADKEPDGERSGRLRQAASLLGGSVRDVAVDVAAAVISRQVGV